MKSIYLAMALLVLGSCGNNQRSEKDITDGEEQNISPNQTITEEEQQRMDSTSGDIIGRDTTRTR
jgi:hypothetical protein